MKQIKRIPVTKQISDSIKDSILKGQFAVGEKLPPEKKLCELLGVSRSSLREAMRELQAQGFIELKAGRGAFVCDNKPHDNESIRQWFKKEAHSLEEYIQVRFIIEPQIAYLAAENGTEIEKLELQKIHLAFKEADIEGNTSQLANIDEEFHSQLFKMSKNSVFQQINELINISLRSYRIRSIAYKQTSSNTVNEHFSIVDAINHSDGKLAKKAMRDHLKVSKSEIETIINWQ